MSYDGQVLAPIMHIQLLGQNLSLEKNGAQPADRQDKAADLEIVLGVFPPMSRHFFSATPNCLEASFEIHRDEIRIGTSSWLLSLDGMVHAVFDE